MEQLQGKRILFIGPIFHNYHTDIAEKLREKGAIVIFRAEREYGLQYKICNNFMHSRLNNYQAKHYHKILTELGNERFDYLFVIRGFKMPASFMEQFRKLNPRATTIMYQWDSQRTNPFSHLVPYFDRVLSFDFEDCARIEGITYHPLFYTDDVTGSDITKKDIRHDFFFMGWYFPERYAAVLKFREYAQQRNWNVKCFLFIPPLRSLKEKVKGKKLDWSILSTTPMPRSEYLDNLRASRIMVDVSNPGQTGLAMRIIEAFTTGTKVLTNNLHLKDDTLFNPDFVQFFDDKNPSVDPAFLLPPPDGTQINTLSISGWLDRFFENHDTKQQGK